MSHLVVPRKDGFTHACGRVVRVDLSTWSINEMHAPELLDHVRRTITTFVDISLVGRGRGFHYSPHAEAIEAAGRMLGAPADGNLDQTQTEAVSKPATHHPGVVFAYENLEDAEDEAYITGVKGPVFEIFEIEFEQAVKATHDQEATLGAPPTLLVMTTDILGIKRLGVTRKS